MECDFKPGDEIVCVNASNGIRAGVFLGNDLGLNKGQTYTVDFVGLRPDGRFGPVVYLREAKNWVGGQEWGYFPERFRKVQKRSSDLSIEHFLTIKPDQWEEPRKVVSPAKPKEKTHEPR